MEQNQGEKFNEFGWRITDHISAMLAYWDNNQVCRFANNAYREWFGKTPDEMIGKITMKELLGDLYVKNLPYIKNVLKGETQIFEREIPLPGGGSRHSIATYYPDIFEGSVKGFFVHVADVTTIKLLEVKLIELEKSKRKEILHSIIETQENEKANIAYELRDEVSQTLSYCKMMLQNINSKETGNVLLEDVAVNIHLAIVKLNELSRNLTPSVIVDFGLEQGIQDYITSFRNRYFKNILFSIICTEVEKLSFNSKVSLFRIIQDYLILHSSSKTVRNISISIGYKYPEFILQFRHDDLSFLIPPKSKEYDDILNRIEYYDGSIEIYSEAGWKNLLIKLHIK